MNMFSTLSEILIDLARGKIVCLSDSVDCENEIDLMCIGQYATATNINYMITHGRGLVCCAMSDSMAHKLKLQPMREENQDKRGTPFYESLDLITAHTGISAFERSETIRHICSGTACRQDFISPGHMFTLKAHKDLLKGRYGHTEMSTWLAERVDPTSPVAVICEIIKDDGTMLTVGDFAEWNKNRGLLLYSIEQACEELGICTKVCE